MTGERAPHVLHALLAGFTLIKSHHYAQTLLKSNLFILTNAGKECSQEFAGNRHPKTGSPAP